MSDLVTAVLSAAKAEKIRLATELLDAVAAIATELAAIDALKIQLRRIADISGSFTERVDGKGKVSVRATSAPKFGGIMPEIDPELFLALDEAERAKLIADGVVSMVAQYSRGSPSAVTVTPSGARS